MSTNSIILVVYKYLLVIGLEPILLKESDFKSDVSTNSTKRAINMAQFDPLIIFPLLWSLTFVLFLYYNMSLQILIPTFFGTKKFREKKINLANYYGFFKKNTEINATSSYNYFA
jgi:hypothetical protein